MDHNNIYYNFADDVNVNIPDFSDVVTKYTMYIYIYRSIYWIENK